LKANPLAHRAFFFLPLWVSSSPHFVPSSRVRSFSHAFEKKVRPLKDRSFATGVCLCPRDTSKIRFPPDQVSASEGMPSQCAASYPQSSPCLPYLLRGEGLGFCALNYSLNRRLFNGKFHRDTSFNELASLRFSSFLFPFSEDRRFSRPGFFADFLIFPTFLIFFFAPFFTFLKFKWTFPPFKRSPGPQFPFYSPCQRATLDACALYVPLIGYFYCAIFAAFSARVHSLFY